MEDELAQRHKGKGKEVRGEGADPQNSSGREGG